MEGSRRLYRGWQQIVIKGQRRLVKMHVGAYSISSCHIHSGDIPHQIEPHGSHQPITGLRPGDFPGLTINQWEALDVARTVITEGQWEREPSLMLAPKLGAWVKSLSETPLWCGVRKAKGGNKQQGSLCLFGCGKASDRTINGIEVLLKRYWTWGPISGYNIEKRVSWGSICSSTKSCLFLIEDNFSLMIS